MTTPFQRALSALLLSLLFLSANPILSGETANIRSDDKSGGIIDDIYDCVVPSIFYEVTFSDPQRKQGDIAFSCSTESMELHNYSGEAILLYLLISEQNLNVGTRETWRGPYLVPTTGYSSNDYFYKARGGTQSSKIEYYFPISITALYDTPDCRQYVNNVNMPEALVANKVGVYHPCSGEGESSGGQPPPADSAPLETAPVETVPPENIPVNPTATQEPWLTGLLYVLFTGSLDGFEDTPEGQALTTREREQVRNTLLAMTLLIGPDPSEEQPIPYPENHPCTGLTDKDRDICQSILRRHAEIDEMERQFETHVDLLANEILRQQRINRVVQEEIGGVTSYFQYVGQAWEKLTTNPVVTARTFLQNHVTDNLKSKNTKDIKLPDYVEVLSGGVNLVKNLATASSVRDYDYYVTIYRAQIKEGASETLAHNLALEELSKHIEGKGSHAWIENGVYDTAFLKLNILYGGE
jgi:hypothetical protein